MRRFPRIQLQEEANASHQAGKQNGDRKAPRTQKKRKKPPLAALNGTSPRTLDTGLLHTNSFTGLLPGLSSRNFSHELFHRTFTGTLFTGLTTQTLSRDFYTNKERSFFLFLLRPLPRTWRDSCPRDPSHHSTTGGRELLTSRQASSSSSQRRGRDVSIVCSLTIKSIRSASNRFLNI